MKKTIFLLMLVLSIKGQTFAQEIGAKTNSDKIFEQPVNANRRFTIDLDKGNKVQIELNDIGDLDRFSNIDSSLRILMQDMETFKDTLSDELSSKRIDYITDTAGVKKIRIQLFRPKGSSYLVNQGDVAALKLEQDTINYVGIVSFKTKKYHTESTALRYYRLSFFLNNINQLPSYINGGLQEKLQNLKNNIASNWVSGSDGQMHLKKDYSVHAEVHKGYIAGSDFLALKGVVDVQNYKQYFVPSFSLGGAFTFSKNYFKKEIGLFWEPQFLFAKNIQGNLQTFRNDFLTLTLAQGFIKDNNARKESPFLTSLSLGYMIKRSGDYYAKNTFRFGGGRLSLFEGKIKIEPGFYFNNFFKGVTPSVRLTVGF